MACFRKVKNIAMLPNRHGKNREESEDAREFLCENLGNNNFLQITDEARNSEKFHEVETLALSMQNDIVNLVKNQFNFTQLTLPTLG